MSGTISTDSPDRAEAFGQLLVASVKRLAEHPELGRVVPEIGDPAVREWVVRPYRVIYRVDHGDCRVDVVRFWHAARGRPEIEI